MTVRDASSTAQPRDGVDALADPLVEKLLNARGEGAVNEGWLRSLARRETEEPAWQEFDDAFAAASTLSDEERVRLRNAQRFFGIWGPLIGLGYLTLALPSTYAARNGVQVLWRTARLQTDTRRRVIETCQLLLAVMKPQEEGLDADALETIKRVRLMHAYVRVLLTRGVWLSTPSARSRSAATPGAKPLRVVGRRIVRGWERTKSFIPRRCGNPGPWDAALGMPINQDDLFATLVAWAYGPLAFMDNESVDYDESQADDYVSGWAVVGRLLGLPAEGLPRTRAEAEAAWEACATREFGYSWAGSELLRSLIRMVERDIPGRWLDPLAHELFYDQLSRKPAGAGRPSAAEALKLRRKTIWRFVYALARAVARTLRFQQRILGGKGADRDRAGYDMFQWIVTSTSEYHARPFQLPEQLREFWGWPGQDSPCLAPRRGMRALRPPVSRSEGVCDLDERRRRADAWLQTVAAKEPTR